MIFSGIVFLIIAVVFVAVACFVEIDESRKMVFLIMSLIFTIIPASVVIDLCEEKGYEKGQIDAIEGKIKYKRKFNQTIEYEKIKE